MILWQTQPEPQPALTAHVAPEHAEAVQRIMDTLRECVRAERERRIENARQGSAAARTAR